MKNLIKIRFIMWLIIFFSTLVSCDTTPDFNIPDAPQYNIVFHINTISEANNELTSRMWKMTNVNVDSTNPNFSDYKITFNNDNTLMATNDEVIYYGTWSVSDSNLNQDVLTDLKLNLVFTSPTIFSQMSKNWTFNSTVVNSYVGVEIKFLCINNEITEGSFFLKEMK